MNLTVRWLEAHRNLLGVYQEPTPPNIGVNNESKKRALQSALAAESRRVKSAQARIKSLKMSIEALKGSENNGAHFVVRNSEDANLPADLVDGDTGIFEDAGSKVVGPDFRKASPVQKNGGNTGEATYYNDHVESHISTGYVTPYDYRCHLCILKAECNDICFDAHIIFSFSSLTELVGCITC